MPTGVCSDFSLKYIEILVESQTTEVSAKAQGSNSAFDVLMNVNRVKKYDWLPEKKDDPKNRQEKLYNEILDVCVTQFSVCFNEKQKDVGMLIINTLTDVCWFLDPFIERFEKRCINIPKVWKFHGFRDWRSQHKKPPQISSEELAKKSNALAKVLMLPWWLNRSFSAFKDSVSELLSAMEYYHKSLTDQLERTQRNHYSSTPVRSVADNWGLTVIEAEEMQR
ncbi:uncharacterized protein LOC128230910 [Mya arenaria]|uniref:uncharacterized protein LOC128230910 n=1 Tax=Mya arenaria TaxID=6604 RepID=UPI0022DF7462|nr:uncharacterized protein LOC128230910 [Mya arenaria]